MSIPLSKDHEAWTAVERHAGTRLFYAMREVHLACEELRRDKIQPPVEPMVVDALALAAMILYRPQTLEDAAVLGEKIAARVEWAGKAGFFLAHPETRYTQGFQFGLCFAAVLATVMALMALWLL